MTGPYRTLLEFLKEEQFALLRLRIQLVHDVAHYDADEANRMTRIAHFLQPMLHAIDDSIQGIKNDLCLASKFMSTRHARLDNALATAALYRVHHLFNLGEFESAFFCLQAVSKLLASTEPEAMIVWEYLLLAAEISEEIVRDEGFQVPERNTVRGFLAKELTALKKHDWLIPEVSRLAAVTAGLESGRFMFFARDQVEAILEAIPVALTSQD